MSPAKHWREKMTDDLVKRLRDGGFLMVDDKSSIKEYYFESEGLKAESADRILKLEAALREVLIWVDQYSVDAAYDDHWPVIEEFARKALEGKDD
jgi:hypothetical protein